MNDPQKFVESLPTCDFFVVFINDEKVGCGCFKTKEAVIKFLKEHSNKGEKIDVLTCDWDD